MPKFARCLTAVAALLIQFSFFQSNGQVMTARFKSITSNTNAFYEYLPQGYKSTDTTRYPLMVYIHGAGDLGNGTASTITLMLRSGPPEEISEDSFPSQVTVNGKTFGFIMIGPQWVTQPTVAQVNNVINYAIANYHVDTTRIYLTGLSMGGGVTWQYAGNSATFANRLAAIVPVCGDIAPDQTRGRIIAASNLPVWATHNDQDPEVPVQYTQQEIAYINTPPAPVPPALMTIFHNNVHDAWTRTYGPTFTINSLNIYQWMLQYTRLSTTANVPPVVTVSAPQSITLPVSTAMLTASATDSLGTIASHTWTFVSGPTTPVISSPTSYNTAITNMSISGVYVFSLTVTDSRNLTVSSNTQITVFPPPTGGNRLINVQLYGGSNAYSNTAWNNWNVSSSLTSGKYNYSDGTPSVINTVLSAQTALADNGPSYTVTMCPQAAARYASYNSASGGRTLTLSGLDNTKIYRVDFYASRNNPSQTTTFAASGVSTTVSTNNNTGTIGTLDNLSPTNGKITVTLTHSQFYDYLNDFTITEKTVINPSTPPVAKAGADQTITLPLDSVTLDGTTSTGVNPLISYQWTLLNGAVGTLETPLASRTILTNLAAGTYSIQLKVTDDSNHIGLDTVNVTVNLPAAPAAKAGPDKSITLPLDSVALDGSASTGTFITYQWSLISGPAVQFANASIAKTELTTPTPGTYLIELTITDIYNRTAIDTIKIIVNPAPPPPPPTANAGPDQSITLPVSSVTLNASASTGKDSIVAYQWTVLSGPAGDTLTAPDSVITTLTNLTVGTYTVQLKVTDDSSLVGLDTLVVTVNPAPPPPPPTAHAGADQSITLPASSVTLDGAASTGKDSIVAYQWTVLSGPAGDTLSSPDSVITTLNNLSAGTYSVQLQVTDDSSQIGKDTLVITVISPAPNKPPVVTVGPNQSITTTTANLTSTSTDPENMISSRQWTKVSAPGQRIMHIGVIGSSTMFGTGPANIDSSLVNRIRRYYKANGLIDTIYNLAVGGESVYNGVTADFVSPGPAPNLFDDTANVTAALAKGIDVLIVGYPSNEYQIGQLTIPEIMAAHQNIFDAATAAGVRCYISTTQPRTSSFDSADEARLLVIRDSLLNRFGEFCMDFMTPVVYPGTYTVQPQYSAGDGIHLSSAAHAQLAAIVEATNPFKYLVSDTSVIATPSTTNTTVSSLDSGVHKYQMGAFDQYKLASSAIVTVTVGKSTPPPVLVPVANAGPDQTITLPTATATLAGSGTETGGKIVSFKWTQTAGTTATIATSTQATTNISGLSTAGTYSFALTVTDSLGAKASDTMTVIVNPAPQTTTKVVNVAIYSFSNPYSNAAWNAWNLGSTTLTSGLFKYSDGTASKIASALSAQTAVADNGPSYSVTMCPQQAARYPSYYSSAGGRTLTLTGLDSTKLYRIDLYASRNNPSQTTIFSTGGSSVTINTNNNTASTATFDNLTPAPGGKIVITITHSQFYDYLNAFTVTEKTAVGGTAEDQTAVTAMTPTITPDTGSIFNQPLAVYPNPTRSSIELHVNNDNTGQLKVDLYSSGGVLVKEFVIAKTTAELDLPLSLDNIRPGDYFIVATIGNWRKTIKLVKLP